MQLLFEKMGLFNRNLIVKDCNNNIIYNIYRDKFSILPCYNIKDKKTQKYVVLKRSYDFLIPSFYLHINNRKIYIKRGFYLNSDYKIFYNNFYMTNKYSGEHNTIYKDDKELAYVKNINNKTELILLENSDDLFIIIAFALIYSKYRLFKK